MDDLIAEIRHCATVSHRVRAERYKRVADHLEAAADALKDGRDLIRGELVGAEWKQACADFLRKVDAVLKERA